VTCEKCGWHGKIRNLKKTRYENLCPKCGHDTFDDGQEESTPIHAESTEVADNPPPAQAMSDANVKCPACGWTGDADQCTVVGLKRHCPECAAQNPWILSNVERVEKADSDTTPPPLSGKTDMPVICPFCDWTGTIRECGLIPEDKDGPKIEYCLACEKIGRIQQVIHTEPHRYLENIADKTPSHYQSASGITPWDLQRGMKTSGSPFVDARRCDAIKYAFRVKENMVEDLRKAAHCLMEAAEEMERRAKGA